jgi:hypothetical protein
MGYNLLRQTNNIKESSQRTRRGPGQQEIHQPHQICQPVEKGWPGPFACESKVRTSQLAEKWSNNALLEES